MCFAWFKKNKQQKKTRKPVKIHNEIVGWKIVDSSLWQNTLPLLLCPTELYFELPNLLAGSLTRFSWITSSFAIVNVWAQCVKQAPKFYRQKQGCYFFLLFFFFWERETVELKEFVCFPYLSLKYRLEFWLIVFLNSHLARFTNLGFMDVFPR